MRTKSKSKFLGSVLSIIAVILCFGFLLTGCGGNKGDNPTTTTISLSEAKTIIVNALEIEEPQTQVLTYTLNEQAENGNRDIFEKLGLFTYSEKAVAIEYETGQDLSNQFTQISGQYSYKNSEYVKYLASLGDSELFYLTNGIRYYNDGSTTQTVQSTFIDEYNIILCNAFNNELFDNAYQQDVEKETLSSGYTLTLNADYKKFVSSLYGEDYSSYDSLIPAELKDWSKVSIIITFDNNDQITKAVLNINSISPYQTSVNSEMHYVKVSGVITVEKYAGEITEPQWVTDYLAEQSQAQE